MLIYIRIAQNKHALINFHPIASSMNKLAQRNGMFICKVVPGQNHAWHAFDEQVMMGCEPIYLPVRTGNWRREGILGSTYNEPPSNMLELERYFGAKSAQAVSADLPLTAWKTTMF
jgi:hypothetical protein